MYKRQVLYRPRLRPPRPARAGRRPGALLDDAGRAGAPRPCLLYTSDAADERSSVDLGGRRIIKNKNHTADMSASSHYG